MRTIKKSCSLRIQKDNCGMQLKIICLRFLITVNGIKRGIDSNFLPTNKFPCVQIDLDTIDVTNLNRQFLFHRRHVGMSKSKVSTRNTIYVYLFSIVRQRNVRQLLFSREVHTIFVLFRLQRNQLFLSFPMLILLLFMVRSLPQSMALVSTNRQLQANILRVILR